MVRQPATPWCLRACLPGSTTDSAGDRHRGPTRSTHAAASLRVNWDCTDGPSNPTVATLFFSSQVSAAAWALQPQNPTCARAGPDSHRWRPKHWDLPPSCSRTRCSAPGAEGPWLFVDACAHVHLAVGAGPLAPHHAPLNHASQRILGVLLRDTCVSVAISNPYHNLSEPVGAVMLRNGTQLPARSFARLLDSWHGDIAGTVLGERGRRICGRAHCQHGRQQRRWMTQRHMAATSRVRLPGAMQPHAGTESQAPSPQQLTAQQAAAYAQIQGACPPASSAAASPGLCWGRGWAGPRRGPNCQATTAAPTPCSIRRAAALTPPLPSSVRDDAALQKPCPRQRLACLCTGTAAGTRPPLCPVEWRMPARAATPPPAAAAAAATPAVVVAAAAAARLRGLPPAARGPCSCSTTSTGWGV